MTRKPEPPARAGKRRDLLLDLERWESRQPRSPTLLDVLETGNGRLVGAYILRGFRIAAADAVAMRERVKRVRAAALRMHGNNLVLAEEFLRRAHASLKHRTPLQEVVESAAGEAIVLKLIEMQRFMDDDLGAPTVIEILEPRFGSKAAASHWFTSVPLLGFGGVTAEELVANGRVQELVDYLDATDWGVLA